MLQPTQAQIERYTESLTLHIACVREAGRKIGVRPAQLAVHDNSKWTGAEFPYYAMKFGGEEPGQDPALVADLFSSAWLHHMHNNPHHWQHWIFPDGFSPKGSSVESGVVEMPTHYVLEMIADWEGASMAYTGSPDMIGWLHDNMPRIRLHTRTADYLRGVLDTFGYADAVYARCWGHESRPGERRL